MFDPQTIIGLDLSLNHFAIVALDSTGQVRRCGYVWSVKKYVPDNLPENYTGLLLPPKEKEEQSDVYTVWKIDWYSGYSYFVSNILRRPLKFDSNFLH